MHHRFTSISHRCRILAGKDALAALPAELRRAGASRVLVFCGATVARRTSLIDGIRTLLGPACAAVFDRAPRHGDFDALCAAADIVRAQELDGIVAVGAGSVLMAARIVAIRAAEEGDWTGLVTRYPEGLPPVSPRLDQPKVPIFNVLTAATTAQDRAGAAALHGTSRLEFFDPKTRPAAIFWDGQALATAPPSLALSTGLAVLWWGWMLSGSHAAANPLSAANARESHALASDAYARLADTADIGARIEMCAAALLLDRYEDDGTSPFDAHWVLRVCYALGGGIFIRAHDIDPGAVYAILTPAAMRFFGERDRDALQPLCGGEGHDLEAGARAWLGRLALPALRLRDLGVQRSWFAGVRDAAMRNVNADRHGQLRHEAALLDATLEAAW